MDINLSKYTKEVYGKNIGREKIILLSFDYDSKTILIGKSDGDLDIFRFDKKTGFRMMRRISFNALDFTIMTFIPKLGNLDNDHLFGG